MSSALRYTRERLAEAAERCSDIDEVITFFGTRPYRNLRRHLYKRFDDFGIDISHFPRKGRHRPKNLPSESQLRDAQSTSIAGVLRLLQRPDNSRLRALVPQLTATYGIDTSHFLDKGINAVSPVRLLESVQKMYWSSTTAHAERQPGIYGERSPRPACRSSVPGATPFRNGWASQ